MHQMFMNEEGWPVVAPHRYSGEKIATYTTEEVTGEYKYVNHGKDITAKSVVSQMIELTADGKITGAVTGTWSLSGEHTAKLTVEGKEYSGVFLQEWNEAVNGNVMTFTALSGEGIAVWGSHVLTDTKE
ncbi:Extracellular endo-alpha-(1-_5)-L-arabinanase 2 precursor [compost metagenome]